MTFRDKRSGAIGSTENPVLIEMYMANTDIYEVVEEKAEEEQVKKPVRRSAKKAE